MPEIPNQEFTHQIIGAAYKIFNELGFGYQEKYYQRAFAEELKLLRLPFQKERLVNIEYGDKIIGRYFIDFEINNKLVVELKIGSEFYKKYINQVLAYLKSSGIRFGLLILFTKDGIRVKRLII